MENGQLSGLCHFSGTYSTLGIKQIAGVRLLVYDNNGNETEGPEIKEKVIWLRSTWVYDGVCKYEYSIDGKIFTPFGNTYKMTWGFYRGDRIGIYCYNQSEEKGYVDVDWFKYDYSALINFQVIFPILSGFPFSAFEIVP